MSSECKPSEAPIASELVLPSGHDQEVSAFASAVDDRSNGDSFGGDSVGLVVSLSQKQSPPPCMASLVQTLFHKETVCISMCPPRSPAADHNAQKLSGQALKTISSCLQQEIGTQEKMAWIDRGLLNGIISVSLRLHREAAHTIFFGTFSSSSYIYLC